MLIKENPAGGRGARLKGKTAQTKMPAADPLALKTAGQDAAARQDWAAALRAWELYAEIEPALPDGFLGQADAYRGLQMQQEADDVLRRYAEISRAAGRPAPAEIAVSYALNAQLSQDWPEALIRWQAARLAHPNAPATWAGEAAMLQITGRAAEAEHITAEAVQRFPDSIDIAAQHCNVALALQDWRQADMRLAALERKFPVHVYTLAAGPGIRAQIERGMAAGDTTELAKSAEAAEAEGQWATAVKLWRIVAARLPDHAGFIIKLGVALREAGNFEEADAVLADGWRRFPNVVEIPAQHAQVAAAAKDWAEAARRWRVVVKANPDAWFLGVMAAAAYREAGLADDADRLLESLLQRAPEQVELHVHHALNAERAGRWGQAVERWNNAIRLRPDDLNFRNSRGDAIWQEAFAKLENSDGAEATSVAVPATHAAETSDDAQALKKLALGFEGLGDNCEFGIVQRRFGADPIGLFRFAAIGAPALTGLIARKLEGLGDPAHTELGLTAAGEYLVRDTKAHWHMHSFVLENTVDPEQFLAKQLTRLVYLKRKLLEDLTNAEKIFVYKASAGLKNAEILDLYQALNAYGKNSLLIVRKIEDGQAPGSVRKINDDLFVGYVATLYDAEDSPIDFTSWRSILERVARERAHRTVGERV